MSEEEKGATQAGAPEQQGGAQTAKPEQPSREAAMERILAARRQQLVTEGGVDPAAFESPKVEEAEAPAKDASQDPGTEASSDAALSVAAQLGKQLEDGTFVLDDTALDRVLVRTKIDGQESLVPITEARKQYQKGAAADLRLQEASRISKEAKDLLEAAKAQSSKATTDAAAKAAEDAKAQEQDELGRLAREHTEAIVNGDDEKAAQILLKIVDRRAQGSGEPATRSAPAATDLVRQMLPALKQELSVESALDKLFKDYPEIKSDSDYIDATDKRVNALVASGASMPEAIRVAGEEVAKKFGLGSFKAGAASSANPTTRDQKLAAKQGLDEPISAATRASSSAAAPKTASQVIAEMARQRAGAPT